MKQVVNAGGWRDTVSIGSLLTLKLGLNPGAHPGIMSARAREEFMVTSSADCWGLRYRCLGDGVVGVAGGQ